MHFSKFPLVTRIIVDMKKCMLEHNQLEEEKCMRILLRKMNTKNRERNKLRKIKRKNTQRNED